MGDKQSIFQIVLLFVFGFLAVGGVIVLALYQNDNDSVTITPVTIWGPPWTGEISPSDALSGLSDSSRVFEKVTYVVKNPQSLYADVLSAIATGRAPDMVIIDQDSFLSLKDILQPISYEEVPMRTFRTTFAEGTELFTNSDGVYAIPLSVDPLILFWNRDLFTNAAIAQVPEDWDTFVRTVPRLANIEGGSTLTQAGVAFGEYDNVLHANEILSALMFQLGNPIVRTNGNEYESVLRSGIQDASDDPTKAIQFYTDFANPVKQVYAWNKTFSRSREAFAANKVALYAGFASEVPTLYKINPNLNFDVSLWPQSTARTNKVTYGKVYGIARLKATRNQARAAGVMTSLGSRNSANMWRQVTALPSARRDLLNGAPDDPFEDVLVRSAIMARSWPEPVGGGTATDDIFRTMINTITSGSQTPSAALTVANEDLEALLEVHGN